MSICTVLCGALVLAQTYQPAAAGVLRVRALRSPQEVADLESRVQANPGDLTSRAALVQHYTDASGFPPQDDASRRIVRLQHILYLVDHHPEAPESATPAAFVSRLRAPYANETDHSIVRAHWLEAVAAHRDDARVVLNAVRFLRVEDKGDAKDVLMRGIAGSPDSREIAANLGFLYAEEILSPGSRAAATAALDQSVNPFVLAGAGTAIPNLAVRATGGTAADPALFDLAGKLLAKARKLAPDDAEIQGPMPMIGYFAGREAPVTPAQTESRLRISEQSANLIRQTPPEYPKLARDAGIKGAVKLSAVIARDGTIQSLQVISGHPLLVPAALDAVKTWVYKPTLLNGAPVETTMEIAVPFQ